MREFGFRSNTDPVEFVLQNSWIEPADVQRDFQWGEREVSELWEDIRRFALGEEIDTAEVYFLGMIIVHGGEARYSIYDGLQRITTLTILASLLRDGVSDEALQRRLGACVLDPRGNPRLRLLGHQYLMEYIQPPGQAMRLRGGRLSGQAEALRRAQSLLRDEIRALSAEERNRVASVLLERVVLLRLLVDSRPMANRVFQTINMRGLRLEDADLIKSRLSEFPGAPQDVQGLLDQWQSIRQALTAKSQVRVGQSEESYKFDRYGGFQGFVLALEMMERATADTRARPLEAVERLNAYVEWMKARHGSATGLSGYFKFVYRCAENWNLLNQPAMGGTNSPFRPLLPIRAVWWTEWKPLVLRVMGLSSQMDRSAGPIWRRRMFDQIHRAAMAMELSNFSPQKRHLVFAKALHELIDGGAPERLDALKMRDQDVVRIHRTLSLPLANYHRRRALILWIEYVMSAPDFRFLGGASVEHILPQSTMLPEAWLHAFPDSQAREQMLNLLGNLILLPKDINFAISDDSFREKRDFINAREADLNGYHLVNRVRVSDSWTPGHIRTRTEEIASWVWDALHISDLSYGAYSAQRA
ncbi:MAG: DUF262 domain-containing protein [Pseudomonadota bacterium]